MTSIITELLILKWWLDMIEFDADYPVFIVGGGVSLEGFDFSQLDDRQFISINQSGLVGGKLADVMIFSEQQFYERHRMSFWRFGGREIVCPDNIVLYEGDIDKIAQHKAIKKSWSAKKGSLPTGVNTGILAINYAILHGATHIVLLGFDGKKTNGKNQWYPSGWASGRGISPEGYKRHLEQFNEAAEIINKSYKDIVIINSNADSAITAWPTGSIDNYF